MKMSASTIDCVGANIDEEESEANNVSPNGHISNGDSPSAENERHSCRFGRQCFRQNPKHRLDVAHPGDQDYTVPNMPEPNKDAANCKYGRKCYRLNPEHFQNFTHPRNINLQQNYMKYVLKRQDRRSSDSFDYDDSDEDPFAGDSGGSDYIPSDEE